MNPHRQNWKLDTELDNNIISVYRAVRYLPAAVAMLHIEKSGLPRQCAHWLAMTEVFDTQSTDFDAFRFQISMSLRGADLKGGDVAISCTAEEHCEVFINIENLIHSMLISSYIHVPPVLEIATPVCALARNDVVL